MSLKDTIQGAREEAAGNRVSVPATEADNNGDEKPDAGFVRKSPSRAKPRREAAAGVRVVSGNGKDKSTAGMSKEEKKAEKKRQREKEDRRYAVSQMLLEQDADYQQYHKVWWRILIVGFVMMVLSMILYALVSSQGEYTSLPLAICALVTLVLAYTSVIIAFIYDWRKVRPIRQACDARASSMSEKRINKLLRERDNEGK